MFRRIGLRDPRRRQASRCLKAFHPANRPVNPCNKPENRASSRKIPWACAQPSQVKVSSGCKTGGDRGVLPIKVSRWRTCPRIFAISGGSSMQAITLSLPPHSGQVSMSMAKTRLSRKAENKTSVLSFTFGNVHPHDLGTIIDHFGVAIRTGHHCTMPLMQFFGVPATARASFGMYNTREEVDVFIEALLKARDMF